MTSGASAQFKGQLSGIRLQLHGFLATMVEGIWIINRAADRISIIFGTDVFDPRGEFF